MTNKPTAATAATATVYERGRVTHYKTGAKLKTIKGQIGHIRAISQDLDVLRKAGGDLAAAGAIRLQREVLMDMIAITPPTIGDLEAKQRCLLAHSALLEPVYLLDVMVGTALRLDYRALALAPEQERRMRDMLPDQA